MTTDEETVLRDIADSIFQGAYWISWLFIGTIVNFTNPYLQLLAACTGFFIYHFITKETNFFLTKGRNIYQRRCQARNCRLFRKY
jgi:hypothetical protein